MIFRSKILSLSHPSYNFSKTKYKLDRSGTGFSDYSAIQCTQTFLGVADITLIITLGYIQTSTSIFIVIIYVLRFVMCYTNLFMIHLRVFDACSYGPLFVEKQWKTRLNTGQSKTVDNEGIMTL